MPDVDVWIWAVLFAISILVVLVIALVAYRAAPGAGWDPGTRSRIVAAVAAVWGGWLLLWTILAAAGVFRADPDAVLQTIAAGVAIPIIAGLWLLRRSASLRRLIAAIPQSWLLAAQTPRVLGVVFLVLLAQHKLPAQFARPAGYGDVFIGLLAPVVAYLYVARTPGSWGVATAFNIAGIADLVVAVGTGFLSAPSPFRLLFSTPSTELMTVLPMVLIPTFLVPTFVLLHVVSLRKLMEERSHSGRVRLPVSPA
jgi:hypothetical protein